MAGGITELADRNLIIARYGTSKKDTYFLSNTPLEDPHPVVEVQPGDTLIVPKAKIVYVLGDVRLPGGYTMTTNESRLSVLQLVARAGGTNPTAVPSHSRLIRKTDGGGYTETPLQLSEMQKGKRGDEMLRPDDVIYVPFSYFRNFLVTGASSLFSSLASAAVYRF
jgi:polysaccharide export outer membrane protein